MKVAKPQPQPDWSAYWAAAIARHKARIAAGCVSAVGVIRIGATAKKDEDEDGVKTD